MRIFLVSVFPEIFDSFISTSLIEKAQAKNILEFVKINPRDFCEDKHKQIDDQIYGGGQGMLMKAKPLIDSINDLVSKYNIEGSSFRIIFASPSEHVFCQQDAYDLSSIENLIFVCGRYEGVDYRFIEYMKNKFADNFLQISLGKFITLGGEVPSMLIIESVVRLISGVIQKEASWQDESYSPAKGMSNIEYPQYTRPDEVQGMKVPEVLLNGNHKEIENWKKNNEKIV